MNILFRLSRSIVAIVLFVFVNSVQAENAEQETSENTAAGNEQTIETSPGTESESETETETETAQKNTANDPVKPDTEVDSEETTEDRIFRPSEDISEDIVIAFPVDI